MRRPRHKTINRREDFSPEQKIEAAPLGMEDKQSFVNLPLICTFRENNKTSMMATTKQNFKKINIHEKSADSDDNDYD